MSQAVAVPDEPVPRAAGKRIPFGHVAEPVREWIADRLGAHEVVREHIGGMSPGCATTLRLASGDRVFVKAVGSNLNEQTVSLFRQELATLKVLPTVRYRPALIDAFDDGEWVAIVLEAFDGSVPRLGDDRDFEAVAAVIEAQAVELTPAPAGVTVRTLAETARRWATRWTDIADEPGRFLPGWAVDSFDDLLVRVERLPGRLQMATLCHFDVRDDNLLIDRSQKVAVIDWGMARLGPRWADLAMLAWQRPTAADADRWLRQFIPDEDQDTVTDLLVAFGGSQSWNACQPPRPNLPMLAAFCRDDAQRLLSLAAMRLVATKRRLWLDRDDHDPYRTRAPERGGGRTAGTPNGA